MIFERDLHANLSAVLRHFFERLNTVRQVLSKFRILRVGTRVFHRNRCDARTTAWQFPRLPSSSPHPGHEYCEEHYSRYGGIGFLTPFVSLPFAPASAYLRCWTDRTQSPHA